MMICYAEMRAVQRESFCLGFSLPCVVGDGRCAPIDSAGRSLLLVIIDLNALPRGHSFPYLYELNRWAASRTSPLISHVVAMLQAAPCTFAISYNT